MPLCTSLTYSTGQTSADAHGLLVGRRTMEVEASHFKSHAFLLPLTVDGHSRLQKEVIDGVGQPGRHGDAQL